MKKFLVRWTFVSVTALVGLFLLQAESADPKIWTEKSNASAKSSSSNTIDAAALNRVFTELASSLSPAVVNIYTKTVTPRSRRFSGQEDLFRFFFGNPLGGDAELFDPHQQGQAPREAQALGSGFVINTEGIIITNSHVVRPAGRNADSIMVKFNHDPESSEGHPATIVGVDESTDVAVLRLKQKKKDLVVAPLGNSDTSQVGEWVIAIGNPYGHTHSVTKGIISARGRALDGINRVDFIQTDASINPGNSGGPLFNLYGEVIGINTAIDARAQGIGFAIPINVAKNVATQILQKGEVTIGWIGVQIAELTPQLAESIGLPDSTQGILIHDIIPGEPAEKAGLKSYDVVTKVNGRPLQTYRDFAQTIGNLPIGTRAKLEIIRDGKKQAVDVTVAKRKSPQELAQQAPSEDNNQRDPRAEPSTARTGLVLSEIPSGLRARLGLEPNVQGVIVQRVQPDSLADLAGIQPGDLITEINRKPIRNLAEAKQALSSRGSRFLVKLFRGREALIILLDSKGDD